MYFYRNKDRMQINYTWNKFKKNNKTEHKSISKDKITESIRFADFMINKKIIYYLYEYEATCQSSSLHQ